MIKKLHHQAKSKILKSEFIRNVVTLITGTTVANVLPIAAAPILTRIFTPKDFGLFAFYFSMVTILAVFTTARYELAITLPKKKKLCISNRNFVMGDIYCCKFVNLIVRLVV